MIEQIVLDHLSEKLDVSVDMERRGQNSPFIVIEKTAGSRADLLNSATIAIQSYGNSLLEAAKLNETVKAAMDEITEIAAVTYVGLNSDYNFTDTTTKDYRYQAVFEIYYTQED